MNTSHRLFKRCCLVAKLLNMSLIEEFQAKQNGFLKLDLRQRLKMRLDIDQKLSRNRCAKNTKL